MPDALRRGADTKIQLGTILAFQHCRQTRGEARAVLDLDFDLKEMFRSDEAIALTNDAMIIGFFKGTPHPDTIDHMSLNLESMRALREALETLKKHG